MPDFDLNHLSTLAACFVEALMRREWAERAPRRLTEPGRTTWRDFRGNLEHQHLLALVAEDVAVRFPLPADPRAVALDPSGPRFEALSDPSVRGLLDRAEEARELDPARALERWARRLDRPTRFRGTDLRPIQAAHRVLELPGTGGLLAARALQVSPEAWLHTNVTVLAADWRDRAMAGLVAMELDTPHVDFVVTDAALEWAAAPERRGQFDRVIGLAAEKGGGFDAEGLVGRFPRASIALV